MSKGTIKYSKFNRLKRNGLFCKVDKLDQTYFLHKHDYYEVSFVKVGHLIHELNGEKENLEAGDIVFLSPTDMHRLTPIDEVEIYKFCIYYRDVDEIIGKMICSTDFPIRGRAEGENFDYICAHFEKMLSAMECLEGFSTQEFIAHSILFLSKVISLSKCVSKSVISSGYLIVTRAMEYISNNFNEAITLNEVASELYVSPAYLSKLFAETCGVSFTRFVAEQRIKYARYLLETSDESILNVALLSGFGSFSSFSRAFKTVVGVTPREYRQNRKKHQSAN